MNFNYKTEAEQQIFVRNKKLTWAFHVLFTIILQTMLVKNVSEELHKDDLYKQLEFGDQNYEVRVEYHRFLRCINFTFKSYFNLPLPWILSSSLLIVRVVLTLYHRT